MKKILIIMLVFFVMFTSFANDTSFGNDFGTTQATASVLFKDIGIRIGNGTFFFNEHYETGLHLLGGMTFGLTQRLEVALEAITPIVPNPFSDVAVGFEFSFAFLGDRVTAIGNAGTGINVLLSLGMFCSSHGEDGKFLPTYLTLRIHPITFGTPNAGKREHFLPMGVAWNFREKKVSMFFSLLMYDHYIKN